MFLSDYKLIVIFLKAVKSNKMIRSNRHL